MRVFMLGWEFPPFISGGLGTACYGLTRAMSRHRTDVIFVLPKAVGTDFSTHVRLLSPQSPRAAGGDRDPASVASTFLYGGPAQPEEFTHVSFRAVPSRMLSPYQSAGGTFHEHAVDAAAPRPIDPGGAPAEGGGTGQASILPPQPRGNGDYGGDLMSEVGRFAGLCVDLARGESFDVIHAHDWMTYPAGLAVARMTGRPLVIHVHSTEFDRSGENVNQVVYDLERRGMHGAMRVITVSHLTKSIVQHRYGVPAERVEVVYNGIENGHPVASDFDRARIRRGDRIVLFLGRITMQKGPEYFVQAAKKVLEKEANVRFIMAGSGDKVRDVIEMAAREGIGQRVLFTGFLRGADVERVFRMADVYVMPSVSEPFGIAPLEAIRHDVPVIISKTSGVAEVLTHALKVDFWDTDEIANKIVAVLRHPPLSTTLRQYADMEVSRLTWDGAATRCEKIYHDVVGLMPAWHG